MNSHIADAYKIPTPDETPHFADDLPNGVGITGRVSQETMHTIAVPTEGPVLSTLQTPAGTPVTPANARPTDLVRFGGMTTTVKVAEQMGILVRHPATGTLIDGGMSVAQVTEQPKQQTPATQAPTGETVERLDDKSETIMTALVEQVDASTTHAALAEVVEGAGVSAVTLGRMASALGVPPEEMRDHLDHLAQSVDRQRVGALSKAGIDAEDLDLFYSWAGTTRPDAGKRAHREHLHKGDLSGWRNLATQFYEHLDEIDPDRILEADFGHGITPTVSAGRVVLNIPGKGQVPYRQAVKLGLIRVR